MRDWIAWFGVARLAVAGLSMVGLVAAAFWLVRAPEPPVEIALPMASGAAMPAPTGATTATDRRPSSAPTSVPPEIVVHVAGAVVAPGVWHMAPGSRVVDAVAAAGGLAADAMTDGINLAARSHDGDRVYVPRLADVAAPVPAGVTPTTGASPGDTTTGPVLLNSASAVELELLPGVGPATAQAIVSYRDENGPFLTVDDLTDVPGIGPAKLEALRDLVTV